jgi:hypothetical protein
MPWQKGKFSNSHFSGCCFPINIYFFYLAGREGFKYINELVIHKRRFDTIDCFRFFFLWLQQWLFKMTLINFTINPKSQRKIFGIIAALITLLFPLCLMFLIMVIILAQSLCPFKMLTGFLVLVVELQNQWYILWRDIVKVYTIIYLALCNSVFYQHYLYSQQS